MDIYGLIGKNISHSFSPDYFTKKFNELGIDAEYKLFELNDAKEFPEFISNNSEIKGLNVTIPYKRALGQYMDFIDEPASICGSINTIKIGHENNETFLSGYNTDIDGFEKSIKPILKNRKNVKALILGSGGGANSVAYVLRKLGILFGFVSRKPEKILHYNYTWLGKHEIHDSLLIINTTPLGMYPNDKDFPPIPYQYITDKHILYDLIYNPSETLFLQKGREHGAFCMNGLEMLELQADATWDIWTK
ncbi:MAG: shikimate dehydrogenase [Bacteroidetes bacterium]|nr:shikimate dehydrogenase [Bacteroidota bacterium]|tara:strand:+ start:452 stop:1198 length:747 start_codon:yes stop_codon:yes gene_type:complete